MAYGHVDSQGEARLKEELGKNTRNTVQKLCEVITVLKENSSAAPSNSSPIIHPVCYITMAADNIYSGYQVFSVDSEGQITYTLYDNFNTDITSVALVVPCSSPYTYELVPGYDTNNTLVTANWIPIFQEVRFTNVSGVRENTGIYYAENRHIPYTLVESFVLHIPS